MSELLNDMQPFVENANKVIDIKAGIETKDEIEFTMQQIPAILNFIVAGQLYQSSDDLCNKMIDDWDTIKKDFSFNFTLKAKRKVPLVQDAEVINEGTD